MCGAFGYTGAKLNKKIYAFHTPRATFSIRWDARHLGNAGEHWPGWINSSVCGRANIANQHPSDSARTIFNLAIRNAANCTIPVVKIRFHPHGNEPLAMVHTFRAQNHFHRPPGLSAKRSLKFNSAHWCVALNLLQN